MAATNAVKGIVKSFEFFLEKENKVCQNTRDSYARDVEKFSEFLNSNGIQIQVADTEALNKYLMALKKRGVSLSTLSRNLASIRSFYRFLQKTKQLSSNPTNGIRTVRVEKKAPQVLLEEEVEQFLSHVKRVSLKGIRDYAMFKLSYGAGLRVSELINLVCSDIDFGLRTLTCRRNAFERTIPLDDDILEALEEYTGKSRPMLVRDEEIPYLFVNCNGSNLTRQGFWKIIKTYKEMSCLEKDITPHTLRHSFAYHLLKKGVDVKTIQQRLGHVDISSTNIYVQMLKKSTVADASINETESE